MLERLKAEVTDRGIDACLPCNLSDEWLSILADSADAMLGNSCADDASGGACLAILLCLAEAKAGVSKSRTEIPLEKLHQYCVRYRLELALEEIHRKTDIRYTPATLETILTERDVRTWRE